MILRLSNTNRVFSHQRLITLKCTCGACECARVRVCVLLTSEAVGHVGLEDDLAEDGGQRQGLVALVPQRDVTVAGLQAVQWQDALANQLVVVIVDGDTQHRQIR